MYVSDLHLFLRLLYTAASRVHTSMETHRHNVYAAYKQAHVKTLHAVEQGFKLGGLLHPKDVTLSKAWVAHNDPVRSLMRVCDGWDQEYDLMPTSGSGGNDKSSSQIHLPQDETTTKAIGSIGEDRTVLLWDRHGYILGQLRQNVNMTLQSTGSTNANTTGTTSAKEGVSADHEWLLRTDVFSTKQGRLDQAQNVLSDLHASQNAIYSGHGHGHGVGNSQAVKRSLSQIVSNLVRTGDDKDIMQALNDMDTKYSKR